MLLTAHVPIYILKIIISPAHASELIKELQFFYELNKNYMLIIHVCLITDYMVYGRHITAIWLRHRFIQVCLRARLGLVCLLPLILESYNY